MTFREICGRRIDQYVYLPAQGTRGGILIAWQQCKYTLLTHMIKDYIVTVSMQCKEDLTEWDFTAVYGPTADEHRQQFFDELRESKPLINKPWLIGGDFNVTAALQDRNRNDNTWRYTLSFSSLISELNMLNLSLTGS